MKNIKYHVMLRILHWSIALIIIFLLFVGWYMEGMEKTENFMFLGEVWARPSIYGLHKSFGMLVLFLMCMRVVVRVCCAVPPYSDEFSSRSVAIAHYGHCLLYGLMIAVPVAGYLMSDFAGYPVKMFGLEVVSVVAKNKSFGGMAHDLHWILAYIMLGFIVLHVGAVVKHCVTGGVNILRRML